MPRVVLVCLPLVAMAICGFGTLHREWHPARWTQRPLRITV
jgi:hypothetical protein